ncbi:MAG: carbon monoxide dehydrogenase subunit G [Kiloniellales bacterium]
MEMTGEYRIPAPRESVWQALNDPEVLKRCIPGCEELEKTSDTSFAAKVKAKVGPVSAKFQGAVTLSDINPPESYTISGEGKGGAAGFAKGGAKVRLAEDGAATRLHYDVQAQDGDKLAQIGSRLIDGTAKKMADDFFGRFAAEFGPAEEVPEPTAAEEAEMAAAAMAGAAPGHAAPSDADLNRDVGKGARPGMWVAGLIIVVILLLLIFGLG